MVEQDFQMEKTYNPQAIEQEIYAGWEKAGAFTPGGTKTKSLTAL